LHHLFLHSRQQNSLFPSATPIPHRRQKPCARFTPDAALPLPQLLQCGKFIFSMQQLGLKQLVLMPMKLVSTAV